MFLPSFVRRELTEPTTGHEMGPGFAKHVASLEGAGVQSLAQLVDFNRKYTEPSYVKGKASNSVAYHLHCLLTM